MIVLASVVTRQKSDKKTAGVTRRRIMTSLNRVRSCPLMQDGHPRSFRHAGRTGEFRVALAAAATVLDGDIGPDMRGFLESVSDCHPDFDRVVQPRTRGRGCPGIVWPLAIRCGSEDR